MKIPTVITDPPVEQRVSESASETGGSDAAAVPAASATVVEPEPTEVEEENGELQGKRKHTLSKKWLAEFTWLAQDSGAKFCKPCWRQRKFGPWWYEWYDDMNMKISD